MTPTQIDMLMKACTHYYHVYSDTGDVARAAEWISLRRQLQAMQQELLNG